MKLPQAIAITNGLFLQMNRLQPFWLLGLRIWIAVVFFRSGLTKIEDFDNTIALFADEYRVPLLPPYLAALSGTFFELVCPLFLTLGLLTRLAALPLLVMTAVIQFTYLDHVQHYYWAIILITLVLFGPERISLDRLLQRYFRPMR